MSKTKKNLMTRGPYS